MSSANNNFEGANGQSAQPSPEKSRALSGDELELQLQRYVDGRLEAPARAEVEEILKRDAAARRMMDALREEEQLLRTAFEKSMKDPEFMAGAKLAGLDITWTTGEAVQKTVRDVLNQPREVVDTAKAALNTPAK